MKEIVTFVLFVVKSDSTYGVIRRETRHPSLFHFDATGLVSYVRSVEVSERDSASEVSRAFFRRS